MYMLVIYYGYSQGRKVIYRNGELTNVAAAFKAVETLVTNGDNNSLFITDSAENMVYHVAIEIDATMVKALQDKE